MVQHAMLFALSTIVVALLVTFGFPLLANEIGDAMNKQGSAVGISAGVGQDTTVDLNLDTTVKNDFLKEFCGSLEAAPVVKISC